MCLADTGGSGLSNGPEETPSGLPGGQGSLLDVLVWGQRQRQVCLCAERERFQGCTHHNESLPKGTPAANSTPKTVPFKTIGYIFLAGGTVK